MNMWKKSAAAAALLLTIAGPAFAAEPVIARPIKADLPFQEVTAKHALPAAITVQGETLKLDQPALLQGENLLVPLRFIVEAAKGEVAWDGETQTITVSLPDRVATFVIGQDEAELNVKGVFYIKRNMIKLAQPVSLVQGRTMVSADALSSILGLVERVDQDANLDLLVAPALGEESASIQIVPSAVEAASAPAVLKGWASARSGAESAAYSVEETEDGRFLAISGGLMPSGGYTVEIVSAKLVDGTWVIEAEVLPPTGPATMALTNPVGYFELAGMDGQIEVHVRGAEAPADR